MSLALYRKYRPQTFKDIIGQQHIQITLEREAATNKVAHAYLFSGPRGTGKTSMARILAKAVNCLGRQKTEDGRRTEGEPCNKCVACKTITEGRALDVLEIDAASHTGVDTVREVIVETAKFAPSSLTFKIFIIDEAHMLTTNAWNALLKIMEEPPKHVLFMLATTEVHKVPLTIISRCQHFAFRRVAVDDLIKRLEFIAEQEKKKIAKSVLDTVARRSEGCVRDAESVLEQLFSLDKKEITEDIASLVLPRNSSAAVLQLIAVLQISDTRAGLELVSQLMDQGIDLIRFTDDLLAVLRDMLIMKVAADSTAVIASDALTFARLREYVNNLDVARILVLIDKFTKARQEFRNAVIPQLPLEIAIVEVCGYNASPISTQKNLVEKPRQNFSNPIINKKDDVATEITQKVNGSAQLTLEQIKSKWAELISRAQVENSTLSFLLSASQPLEIDQNILQIGVQYSLHCNKLNEHKCRAALENLLTDIYQTPLRAKGIIVQSLKKDNDDIADVLKAFGGRLVD